MKHFILNSILIAFSSIAFASHGVKVISKVTEFYKISGLNMKLKDITYEVGTFHDQDGLAVDVQTLTEVYRHPVEKPFDQVLAMAYKSRGLKKTKSDLIASKRVSDTECAETAAEMTCATSYEFSF